MFKNYITLLFLVSFLVGQPREINFGGGPHQIEYPTGLKCISEEERSFVREHRIEVDHDETMRDTVLFQDPMGNGGMMNINDSVGHQIWNYVDQNSSLGWILDYTCNYVTYDGHQGTDIVIPGFYYMDEMITPIVAAAPGIVTYSHDGEFDRQTYWINGAVANAVIISHSNGLSSWYWHMKTNSVAVATGDNIEIGDTLGFVGSSGFSSAPHLHFEVEAASGNFIDPWEGTCGDGPSLWADQLPFVGDTSVYESKLLQYLTTSYPINNNIDVLNYVLIENLPDLTHINPGGDYLAAVYVRNLFPTDTLKRRFYRDGDLVDEYNWVPGNSNYWGTGVTYYTTSLWYFWGSWFTGNNALGDWTEKFYINSKLVGEKSYVCDNIPNQSPGVDFQQISVAIGETITGEFTATDDGDPFWFNLETEPNHGGEIELYGGRRRKFEYTAPIDFTGYDVVGISATDDRGETGATALIIFEVSGTGLTNLTVEPSYVSPLQDSVFISAEILGEVDEPSILAYINDMNNGDQAEVELIENDGIWSAYWAPETESFFNVDLQLINETENDTVYYQDVGYFTSVGPVSVNMVGDLIAYLADGVVLDFIVENNSTNQVAPDISILFEAESMDCLTDISQNIIFLGDIAAGESVPSNPYFFVAFVNNDCNADSTILINVNIRSGENIYWYDDFVLNIEMLSTADGEAVPKEYALGGAYPNPFNPIARIDYDLIQKNYVTLEIHNLIGRKVKTLVSLEKDVGFHSTYWDATNNAGDPVAAGVYLYTIQAGEFRQTKKMILLK